MQLMAAQLIAERAVDEASILVLGAGGGLEIKLFSELYPRWRFTGVDPAPEMLKQAKRLPVARVVGGALPSSAAPSRAASPGTKAMALQRPNT